MTPHQRLYAYYGSRKEAARQLGVSRETIRLWLAHGLPLKRSKWIERKTQGFVTADEIFMWWKKKAA